MTSGTGRCGDRCTITSPLTSPIISRRPSNQASSPLGTPNLAHTDHDPRGFGLSFGSIPNSVVRCMRGVIGSFQRLENWSLSPDKRPLSSGGNVGSEMLNHLSYSPEERHAGAGSLAGINIDHRYESSPTTT